jgi:hypothetical protein
MDIWNNRCACELIDTESAVDTDGGVAATGVTGAVPTLEAYALA